MQEPHHQLKKIQIKMLEEKVVKLKLR